MKASRSSRWSAEIAEDLGVTVGDTIARERARPQRDRARSPTCAELEWESLSINFVMVFSPNTFRGAPHAHLATLRLPDGAGARCSEREVLSAVTRAFPA